MKRSKMLQIIETAIDQSCGADPDTGERLYPPLENIAYVVLMTIENAGMLPPGYMKPLLRDNEGNQYPLVPGDFKNDQNVWCTPGVNEWEKE
jgi:hypothetical protein